MKNQKQIFVIIIILATIIAILPLFRSPTPHIYIALGDSISSGYGLPGYSDKPEGIHTTIFFEKLKQNGYVTDYHNFATSGFTTADLLNQLNSKTDEEKHLFRNAQVITINIGGNNILTPFLAYLADLQVVSAINTWRGILSPELKAMFDEGVQTFNNDLKEIVTWLQSNAPHATIIINTIHNPIPQEIMMISVPISNWSYTLTTYMNQSAFEKSEQYGFLVADINALLSQRVYLTNFNINPFAGELSLDLVHPNEEGHQLIAELNYSTFMGKD